MERALFTKTITKVYQYEVDVDNIQEFYRNRYTPEIADSFNENMLVKIDWDVDVEEVYE